jgi:membrane protein DedA with SNARE-associated domain/membrane-associated phospholipid phosphatase
VTVVAVIKWSWLLGAVALAGYLLTRRRKLGKPTFIAGWVVVAAAAAVGAGLIHLPNLEELILRVGETLGPWTYLLVGALAFLETGAFVGLVAPGETAVIVGGLVAGQGKISLPVLIAVVWTCAVAGDLTSYTIGRRLGRDFLLRHGERLKITDERLTTVEGFFRRRGGATILIGRFIGFVRPLAPFVAGAARLPLRTFLPYDVLGAGAWSATFSILGYVFWRSFHQLTTYVSRGLVAFATVVVIGVGIWFLVQLRRDPQRREKVRAWLAERENRRGWGPFVRAAGPLWRRLGRPTAAGAEEAVRFSWARLTPGRLGLELTTMLALLAVGAFAFFLIGDAVTERALTGLDDAGAQLASDTRDGVLVDIAKIVTAIGSLPAVIAAALVTAVAVGGRRRWIDMVALLAGVGLSYLAVHIAKAAYDRPRPPGSLVHTIGSAYPSGHAAYAVTLVACATVLVRARMGWAVRIGAVTVAIVLVAVVAVTRVYLGAHYVTDVLGGIALGAAIWAVVGSVAMVVVHVRHNVARVP